jgi:hypothetical protein
MSNADEALILKYLNGFKTTDEKSRPTVGYLEPDSEEELMARRALTTLLRGVDPIPDAPGSSTIRPISSAIRDALASLFTPDEFCASDRKIKFMDRYRKRPKLREHLAVGEFLHREAEKVKFESAVTAATVRFKLSRTAVLNALELYRRLLNGPSDESTV